MFWWILLISLALGWLLSRGARRSTISVLRPSDRIPAGPQAEDEPSPPDYLTCVVSETTTAEIERMGHGEVLSRPPLPNPPLPRLAGLLLRGNSEQVAAATRAALTLLNATQAEDLPSLEEQVRHYVAYDSCFAAVTPATVREWNADDGAGRRVGVQGPRVSVLLRLCSMHPSGFVREAAVRELARVRDGSELPFLLLRVNDWVEQVRAVAQTAVVDRIGPAYGPMFVRAYSLVLRLERAGRVNHRALVASIKRLLAADRRGTLAAIGVATSRHARRAIFELLVESERPGELVETLRAGIMATDPVIRLRAVRAAALALDPDGLRPLIELASGDPFPAVRQAALDASVTRLPQESGVLLRSALLDANAGVRSLARFRLRERGNFDFRSFYREALGHADRPGLPGAIGGLAETGGPEDADLLVPLLADPRAKIRAAAAGRVIRLGGDRYVDRVLPCIRDESAVVSRFARIALQRHGAQLRGAQLLRLLDEDRCPHVRMNLLTLLAAMPKWEAIIGLLCVAIHPDPSIASRAREYVARWDAAYNRSQVSPTREQLDRLEAALSRAQAALPERLAASLSRSARGFGA